MGFFSSIFAVLLPFLLAVLASATPTSPSIQNVTPTVNNVEVTPVTFIRKNDEDDNMVGKRLSRGERLCRKVIMQLIKERGLVANVIHNYRPDFLKNPKTKRNLELDIFVSVAQPDVKEIAVEFNGRQHDEFVPKYHKNKAEFANQQYRDKLKTEICAERKINLITISHLDIDHLSNDGEKEAKIRSILDPAF